jgi:hypothetical protein
VSIVECSNAARSEARSHQHFSPNTAIRQQSTIFVVRMITNLSVIRALGTTGGGPVDTSFIPIPRELEYSTKSDVQYSNHPGAREA